MDDQFGTYTVGVSTRRPHLAEKLQHDVFTGVLGPLVRRTIIRLGRYSIPTSLAGLTE
jgi:hypothetical protein